jgi:DNA invertase Pin-like site-specific DNA recombinase
MNNFMLLRVSKEDETLQDLDIQETKLKEKYALFKDCVVYKERGSAYDLDKFDNRKEFIKILELTSNASKTSILDLFRKNYTKTNINLAVWDYSRLMRNLELGLLLSIIFKMFNVTIYSYKQGIIKIEDDEIPVSRFTKYILASANSFEAESYSWNISENVKKAIDKDAEFTRSNPSKDNPLGNKWGGQFSNILPDGTKEIIKLSEQEERSLVRRIDFLIKKFDSEGKTRYYPEIIEDIRKSKGILLSASYISRCKNGSRTEK